MRVEFKLLLITTYYLTVTVILMVFWAIHHLLVLIILKESAQRSLKEHCHLWHLPQIRPANPPCVLLRLRVSVLEMLNSLSGRCGQSCVSQSQEEIWHEYVTGGGGEATPQNVESVCIFGRGYQPDMSADSIHRAGRLKMNRIITNRDFTTESSTLTFILAPLDMTWRAGLEWSPSQHPPTSAPAHQCLCHAPFSLSWEGRRSYTSWCSLLQESQHLGQTLS